MKRRIQHLIADMLGLRADSLSEEAWEKILRERMHAVGVPSLALYHSLLLTSPAEMQELIERLTVQEGWFFRDRAAFDLLASIAKEKRQSLRLLSMACSTGEEPYSMAMALLKIRMPYRFLIDAVDVNRSALSYAEKGLYTNHAFRGKSLEGLEHFFEKRDGHYQLKKEVREHVIFSYGNICHPSFADGKSLYDVILLRNVLFYLTPQAQKRVLQHCTKLLAHEGVLITTPAESAIVEQHGFVLLEKGRVFGLRRAEVKKEVKRKAPLPEMKVEIALTGEKSKTLLEEAEEQANRGKFAEAESLCRKWLENEAMDAKAHLLLGVIHHAQGNEKEAEASFLKALYLQPLYEEALIYLALLAEKRGDTASADRYRKRLKKV
ncbi:MAG: hypothetical protein LLG04_02935 [Parachlamydia sp.]|nr:hypothetical protein [Parachlamydia sp.]